MSEPASTTVFERINAAKIDQLRQAQSAGATVAQLKAIADDFDAAVIQGATNDIGTFVFESEDPYQTYLDISNASNQTYQELQAQGELPGWRLPQHIRNALGIMVNTEDRQKAVDHARKAWTSRDEDRRIGERKQKEEIEQSIKDQKVLFNTLLLDFPNMDEGDFLIDAENILQTLEDLGEPDIIELREKIVEGSVGGKVVVFNPISNDADILFLEERIRTEDPTLDLGDLNKRVIAGSISYADFKRFGEDIVNLMDANLQEALAEYRPGLMEGMVIFSGQGNEDINNYTKFKRAAGRAQRKAIRQQVEFDPYQWAEDNHASFMENEEKSAREQLLIDLQPFTFNENVNGFIALQNAIATAEDLSGADSDQAQRLRTLRDRAKAYIVSGKTIPNYSGGN